MFTAVTQGVKVSVQIEYQAEYSSPAQEHFVFTYQVTIENNSDYTIQLKRRRWHIHDAKGQPRVVEGEGVVGQQPTLEPGQRHAYVSGCNLKSGLGKMFGAYEMERVVDGRRFEVTIPEFTMVVPYRLN